MIEKYIHTNWKISLILGSIGFKSSAVDMNTKMDRAINVKKKLLGKLLTKLSLKKNCIKKTEIIF